MITAVGAWGGLAKNVRAWPTLHSQEAQWLTAYRIADPPGDGSHYTYHATRDSAIWVVCPSSSGWPIKTREAMASALLFWRDPIWIIPCWSSLTITWELAGLI